MNLITNNMAVFHLLVLFLCFVSHHQTSASVGTTLTPASQPLPPPPPPLTRKSQPPPPVIERPPPKSLAFVEGVVYCASCRLRGFDKRLGAAPLPGALATLICRHSKLGSVTMGSAKTDRHGYFIIKPKKLLALTIPICRVEVTSTLRDCSRVVFPTSPMRLVFERVDKAGGNEVSLFTARFFEMGPGRGPPITCPRVP